MLKMKKHMVTLACLVTGMLVLTTSVYANFDDAKGYSNYKEAIKKLVFEEENLTVEANAKLSLDGEQMVDSTQLLKMADGDSSAVSSYKGTESGDNWTSYNYVAGNKSYSYIPSQDNTYYEYERTRIEKTMVPLDDSGMSSASTQKAIRFMELLADTMVGDLKNNVVLDSAEENGVRNYTMDIQGSQIPEVVNAGLSLLFTANADVYGNGDSSDNMFQMYANDARIDSAKCTFSLDEKGRLTANYLEATLTGEDANGKTHNATMSMKIAVSDYGTTVPDVFDPEGKVPADDRPEAEVYTVEPTEQ